MLESSKFDCPILTEHNLTPCQLISIKNFQRIVRIYWSIYLYNCIQLFSKLTDLLTTQKGNQFNWDTV